MNTDYIQSLLDDKIKTIAVTFDGSDKEYTFKTNLDCKEGDYALVQTTGGVKITTVVRVDNIPNIDPNSNIKYKWVLSITDSQINDHYKKLDASFNEKIIEKQREAHRKQGLEELKTLLGDVKTLVV